MSSPLHVGSSRSVTFLPRTFGTVGDVAPERPRFVVTGTGRSGTGFIAAVLAEAGLRCGHETLFGPRTRRVPPFDALDGDISWLAAPFVGALPPGTVVLHQLRDPVEVVSSWVGLRFLHERGPYSFLRASGPPRLLYHEVQTRLRRARGERSFVARDFERFVLRHEPSVGEGATTVDRCLRYWVRWNERVEAEAASAPVAYLRYRVEDVADRWHELAALLHVDPAVPDAARAAGVNSRPRHDAATIEDLRRSPDHAAFAALARRYGYDVGDATAA